MPRRWSVQPTDRAVRSAPFAPASGLVMSLRADSRRDDAEFTAAAPRSIFQSRWDVRVPP